MDGINRNVSGLHVATSFPGPSPWLVDASQLFKRLGKGGGGGERGEESIKSAANSKGYTSPGSRITSWYLGRYSSKRPRAVDK